MWSRINLMRIWIPLFASIQIQVTIRPFNLMRSQIRLSFDVDPDPDPVPYQRDASMWPLVYRLSTAPFWAFTTPLRASLAFRIQILFLLLCGSGSGSSLYTDDDPNSTSQNSLDSCWYRFGPQHCCYITHAGIEKNTPFKRFKYGTVPYRIGTVPLHLGPHFYANWIRFSQWLTDLLQLQKLGRGTSFLVMFNVRRVDA